MTSSTQSYTGAPLRSDLVTAIDHVGVAVPDLDAAIAWYTDHLGMVAVHEEVNEEQGVREAMLSFPGAGEKSAALQLLAPIDESSTIAKFIDRNGPGLQQLAYRVTDIDEISSELRARGVRLLYDAPAAVRPIRVSTSYTPRTQAEYLSNWSNRTTTRTDRTR